MMKNEIESQHMAVIPSGNSGIILHIGSSSVGLNFEDARWLVETLLIYLPEKEENEDEENI